MGWPAPNPRWQGGPDGRLAQLYGGNLGDGGYVVADYGQQFSGTLKIDWLFV